MFMWRNRAQAPCCSEPGGGWSSSGVALVGLVVGLVALAGCGETESTSNDEKEPTISGFSPIKGPIGTEVSIKGTRFGKQGWNLVKFNGAVAEIAAESSSELVVIVPEDAYPTYATFGSGWECYRGFRELNGACKLISVPEHGYLSESSYGSG